MDRPVITLRMVRLMRYWMDEYTQTTATALKDGCYSRHWTFRGLQFLLSAAAYETTGQFPLLERGGDVMIGGAFLD
jgi:hypothetical protein